VIGKDLLDAALLLCLLLQRIQVLQQQITNRVRWLEIQRSGQFVCEQLASLPEGPLRSTPGPLAPDTFALSLRNLMKGLIQKL
jgi:hypothetical protein